MSLRFFASAAPVLILSALVFGQDGPDARQTVQNLIDGTVRGLTYQAGLDEQQTKALAAWKRMFLGKPPVPVETARLFLYGSVPGKSLKEIGATLDKQYALAGKVLNLEHEEPWPGKMSVFFLNERNQYATFIRVMEQRRLEEGEVGTFGVDGDLPYAAASAPLAKIDPPLEGQAGEQLAAALLMKKGGAKVPTWFLSGFGRATVLRSGSLASLTIEHRRAYQFLVKGKRSMKDLGGGLDDEEAAILRANFVEYLAYSGRIGRFLAIVEGFRPREGVAEPTLENAFQAANLKMDLIDGTWQKWVKSLK